MKLIKALVVFWLLAPIVAIALLVAPMFATLPPDRAEPRSWDIPTESSICEGACMDEALARR